MKTYLKRYFAWDLLSCAPFYWLFFTTPWVRINRFINLVFIGFDIDDVVKIYVAFSLHVNVQALRVWVHENSLNNLIISRGVISALACACISLF